MIYRLIDAARVILTMWPIGHATMRVLTQIPGGVPASAGYCDCTQHAGCINQAVGQ